MDTELQTAKKTAKRITDWGADTRALFGDVATLARVFLAQQEQVAALEAERDALAKQVEVTRNVWERQARQYNDERYAAIERAVKAESRLASARVEAFKAGWERFAELARDCGLIPRSEPHGKGPHVTTIYGIYPDAEARKKYPAPAAPAGEQVRPAPTPEPEECARTPLRVIAGWESTDKDADGDDRVWYIAMCEDGSVWARQTFLTNDQPWQRQAPSIVALGSRPTQTAEG